MIYRKVREEHSLRATPCSQRGVSGLIRQSWWVLLFISACFLVFLHFSEKKNRVISSLGQHLSCYRVQKAKLLQENEELKLQINSQSDPAWIQLTLMKGLGLVPEGQLKVYFHGNND